MLIYSHNWKLAVYNMNNLYDCVVNAIELDLQQCDPKIGITRKVKISEKLQFFQLIQTVTTKIFQPKCSSFRRDNFVYRAMMDDSLDEPCRDYQKLISFNKEQVK